MQSPNYLTVSAVLIALAAPLGCGSSDPLERVVVFGAVSVNGEPVPKGRIRFTPAEGTAGTVSVAIISEGEYRYDHNGGVPVGTHRVQIWGFPADAPESPGPGGPPIEQLVPAKYNLRSELSVTVSGENRETQQDFALSKE